MSSSGASAWPSSRPSTGRASFRSQRSVAKTVLDLANGHFDLTTLQGAVFNRISGTLGDKKYNDFCTDCTLVTINYCQRALEQVANISAQGVQVGSEQINMSEAQVQRIQRVRGLVNHDYLVLELESGGSGKLHIVAEKLTGRTNEVGIHIEALVEDADVDYRLHKGVRLYAISCGTKISLPKIEEILKTATDPHYNLRDYNCWDYAFAATRRLLNECTACVGPTSPEYNRLKDLHDNLKDALGRHSIKATLKTAWNSVRSSSSGN